ncbi:MAG: hypothetical protein IPO29_14770 [Anaerolineae bacterium]|nr:hypothetical protein [Anaerolineae bacterium]
MIKQRGDVVGTEGVNLANGFALEYALTDGGAQGEFDQRIAPRIDVAGCPGKSPIVDFDDGGQAGLERRPLELALGQGSQIQGDRLRAGRQAAQAIDLAEIGKIGPMGAVHPLGVCVDAAQHKALDLRPPASVSCSRVVVCFVEGRVVDQALLVEEAHPHARSFWLSLVHAAIIRQCRVTSDNVYLSEVKFVETSNKA